jgi:hypothetical protein
LEWIHPERVPAAKFSVAVFTGYAFLSCYLLPNIFADEWCEKVFSVPKNQVPEPMPYKFRRLHKNSFPAVAGF